MRRSLVLSALLAACATGLPAAHAEPVCATVHASRLNDTTLCVQQLAANHCEDVNVDLDPPGVSATVCYYDPT
jgi:hypothetical protein